MALLDILIEGDPRLRQKAHKIRHVDDSLRSLAADMFETMLDAPGVGLAAPQVGVMRR
jgi:peptide deformylase